MTEKLSSLFFAGIVLHACQRLCIQNGAHAFVLLSACGRIRLVRFALFFHTRDIRARIFV